MVAVVGPGSAPGSAVAPVGSTEMQFFMCPAWHGKSEASIHEGN